MFAGIRKRLGRKTLDIKECEDDDKDELDTFAPPSNYIKISQGKIQLVHQSRSLENEITDAQSKKDKEVLESRIVELEEALLRVQEKVNNSQYAPPTFEKELREQMEHMKRVMKSKERKQMQTFRDHKALQARFARQESLLHAMQQENKALLMRIRQYEHCLDDVMRKVVDAIVAEDNLREEVAVLKSRVRDLEEQNAALSVSPAKGRDEGYCTMSSGQPQPSNGHLEDLPEEPEQWLPGEPCSTEMEDWSMSQEELAVITLDDEREQQYRNSRAKHLEGGSEHEWSTIWNSNDFLNSTMAETDSASDSISQLLQQKIVYSEDEEVTCIEFTNDFYKLVNIRSNSARSLYSYIEGETDDEDSSSSESNVRLRSRCSAANAPSPSPSEAGRAQVTSCSSSESDELPSTAASTHAERHAPREEASANEAATSDQCSDIEIKNVQRDSEQTHAIDEKQCIEEIIKAGMRRPPPPPLVKSKSTLDEDEPSCVLRHNQRQDIAAHVLRSGSVHCGIAAKAGAETAAPKIQERLLLTPTNSWRKSNGWKRLSPTQTPSTPISPKTEIRTDWTKCFQGVQKLQPTKIPTCIPLLSNHHHQQQQQQHHQQQQLEAQKKQLTRKSKIPPPVPVRRSYAS